MTAEPDFTSEHSGNGLRLLLSGGWTIGASRMIEDGARRLVSDAAGATQVVFDLSAIDRMDTAGAWLIDRSRSDLEAAGTPTQIVGARHEYEILLREAHYRDFAEPPKTQGSAVVNLLADVGETVVMVGRDTVSGVNFFGRIVSSAIGIVTRPARFRATSVIYHIENFGLRALPIIVLINFLVGCIVAQQGLFQLRRFGASTFTVDLIGILVLRELAVLLTSIMIAGRTGSAITAELGSMKMREEVDALRVMGLDPIDVLVMPRLLALIISLPLLTFLADLAAIFGGLVVAWTYGGISPEIFLTRLKDAIAINTFLVGMFKAPVMALVIGMISAIEGFAVEGSAESLGKHVTVAVVKSIFMVILVDGLFAMFFAYIDY
jgi:phospholipid/cholesterol/gamma-HCH transport system permease protein